jgi:hypothetical protein
MKSERGDDAGWSDFDGTFEGARHRQSLAGLQLDHVGRLRWLESRMSELLRLAGKAAEPIRSASSDGDVRPGP